MVSVASTDDDLLDGWWSMLRHQLYGRHGTTLYPR